MLRQALVYFPQNAIDLSVALDNLRTPIFVPLAQPCVTRYMLKDVTERARARCREAVPPAGSLVTVPGRACFPGVVGSPLQAGERCGKRRRHAQNDCGLLLETPSQRSPTGEFAAVSEILGYSANATRFDPFRFDTGLYFRRKRQDHGPDRGSVVFRCPSCDLYEYATHIFHCSLLDFFFPLSTMPFYVTGLAFPVFPMGWKGHNATRRELWL